MSVSFTGLNGSSRPGPVPYIHWQWTQTVQYGRFNGRIMDNGHIILGFNINNSEYTTVQCNCMLFAFAGMCTVNESTTGTCSTTALCPQRVHVRCILWSPRQVRTFGRYSNGREPLESGTLEIGEHVRAGMAGGKGEGKGLLLCR
jgi:hypothetical protein